jgi:hypothetical protein
MRTNPRRQGRPTWLAWWITWAFLLFWPLALGWWPLEILWLTGLGLTALLAVTGRRRGPRVRP